MPRKIYVHVGPTKTGTSTIQNILSNHDNSVVIYPKVGLWGPGAHHGLVYGLLQKGRGGSELHAKVPMYLSEIVECVRGNDLDMFFSSEELLASVGRLKARGNAKAFIEAILSVLDRQAWEVEVLFTCREHFERAASAYSQRLKGRNSTEKRDPDQFLIESLNSLEYARMLGGLRNADFRVSAINYHPAETYVARFLAHLGFGMSVTGTRSRNVSLSPKALIAKLAANRALVSDNERHRFSEALKSMDGYQAPSQFLFGADVAQEARIRFAADRQFLIKEFGVELPVRCGDMTGNMFFLDKGQLADISTVAEVIGEKAHRIVDAAAHYVRHPA